MYDNLKNSSNKLKKRAAVLMSAIFTLSVGATNFMFSKQGSIISDANATAPSISVAGDNGTWWAKNEPAEYINTYTGTYNGIDITKSGSYKFTDVTSSGSESSLWEGLRIADGLLVHIYIFGNCSFTGKNASGTVPAGAGIGVPSNTYLYIHGSGSLTATGGNAADGSGNSGTSGGSGGGGGGAGIGTNGARAGSNSSSAGKVFIFNQVSKTITGGSNGGGGSGSNDGEDGRGGGGGGGGAGYHIGSGGGGGGAGGDGCDDTYDYGGGGGGGGGGRIGGKGGYGGTGNNSANGENGSSGTDPNGGAGGDGPKDASAGSKGGNAAGEVSARDFADLTYCKLTVSGSWENGQTLSATLKTADGQKNITGVTYAWYWPDGTTAFGNSKYGVDSGTANDGSTANKLSLDSNAINGPGGVRLKVSGDIVSGRSLNVKLGAWANLRQSLDESFYVDSDVLTVARHTSDYDFNYNLTMTRDETIIADNETKNFGENYTYTLQNEDIGRNMGFSFSSSGDFTTNNVKTTYNFGTVNMNLRCTHINLTEDYKDSSGNLISNTNNNLGTTAYGYVIQTINDGNSDIMVYLDSKNKKFKLIDGEYTQTLLDLFNSDFGGNNAYPVYDQTDLMLISIILDCNPGARGINIDINDNICMSAPLNWSKDHTDPNGHPWKANHDIYDNDQVHNAWDRFYRPLGSDDVMFSGKIKGNNKVINYITVKEPNKSGVGLIGYMSGGRIDNLTLSMNVTGRNYVGGLVGFAHKSVIRDCVIRRTDVTGSSDTVGGLAGELYLSLSINNNLKQVSNSINITGNQILGGLAGEVHNSEIYNSGKVSETITITGSLTGKIVAYNYNSKITSDSYPDPTPGNEKLPTEKTRPSEDSDSSGGNTGGSGGNFDYKEPNIQPDTDTGINPF